MRQLFNQRGEVSAVLAGLLLVVLIAGVGAYAYHQHSVQANYNANASTGGGHVISRTVSTPTVVQNDTDGAAAEAAGRDADNQDINAAQLTGSDTQ